MKRTVLFSTSAVMSTDLRCILHPRTGGQFAAESGGHFAAEFGGHFTAESGGHFAAEFGGHYTRNFQQDC